MSALRSAIVSLPAGTDVAPLLKDLPDDLCPCPHWGYVIKGQLRVIYADGQEVLRAGDVYYMPAGHSGVVEEAYEGIQLRVTRSETTRVAAIRRREPRSRRRSVLATAPPTEAPGCSR